MIAGKSLSVNPRPSSIKKKQSFCIDRFASLFPTLASGVERESGYLPAMRRKRGLFWKTGGPLFVDGLHFLYGSFAGILGGRRKTDMV
jgi:hypothetical protein